MAEYVKKNDALKILADIMTDRMAAYPTRDDAMQEAIRCISNLPAEAVQKPENTGHWIELDSCMTMCSECKSLGCGTPYCSVCGSYNGGDDDGCLYQA